MSSSILPAINVDGLALEMSVENPFCDRCLSRPSGTNQKQVACLSVSQRRAETPLDFLELTFSEKKPCGNECFSQREFVNKNRISHLSDIAAQG